MSQLESHHVTVELKEHYQFVTHFEDVEGRPTLVCDEPSPVGEGRGPSAAAVLGAAVGNCLAASLTFRLRQARLDPVHLSAEVTTHVAHNDRGRLRIVGIDVELCPELGLALEADDLSANAFFDDFCSVTASIRRGIPVSVSMRRPHESGSTA